MLKLEVLDKVVATDVAAVERLIAQLTTRELADAAGKMQTIVQSPDADLVVAREESAIVGMVVINVQHKVLGREGRIDEVVVDEAHRGKGIASQLMERAIDELRDRGCKLVELTSSGKREAANKLYQAVGFERRETNVYRLRL